MWAKRGGVGESLGVQGESVPLSAPESQSKAGVGTSFGLPSRVGWGSVAGHTLNLGLCEGSRMSSEPECEPGTVPGKKSTVVKKGLAWALVPVRAHHGSPRDGSTCASPFRGFGVWWQLKSSRGSGSWVVEGGLGQPWQKFSGGRLSNDPRIPKPWQEQGGLVSDCLMFDGAPRVAEMLGSLAREDLEGPCTWVGAGALVPRTLGDSGF